MILAWLQKIASHFVMQSKMPSYDSDDRMDWDRAWRAEPHRQIIDPVLPKRIITEFARWGPLKFVTVCLDPLQYSDRVYRQTEICPICGSSTIGSARIPASLNLEYVNGHGIFIGVWVHDSCFDRCPMHDSPKTIPW